MSVIFSSALKNLFKKNKKNEPTSEASDKDNENHDADRIAQPSRIFPGLTESTKDAEDK